jgi:hypothetical protein
MLESEGGAMESENVTVRQIDQEHSELWLIELTDGRSLTVFSDHVSIAIGWSPNDTLEVTATRDITKMYNLLVKHQATGQEIWARWFENLLFPARCMKAD